jgi:hypothetical protein
MSFLAPEQLDELIRFALFADREARSDLAKSFIKDENDYTSNFTGALRRIINSNSECGLSATSFLIPHSDERQIGGDAAIILTRGGESKVSIFEGKWPRFRKPGYAWDYYQTAEQNLSHFSDQLERQKRWKKIFAVFEMFYCEYPLGRQPPFLERDGSSCVWHNDAAEFNLTRPHPNGLWTQDELKTLLQAKRVSISDVMKDFGICDKGEPIRSVKPMDIGREYHLPQRLLAIKARRGRIEPPG